MEGGEGEGREKGRGSEGRREENKRRGKGGKGKGRGGGESARVAPKTAGLDPPLQTGGRQTDGSCYKPNVNVVIQEMV